MPKDSRYAQIEAVVELSRRISKLWSLNFMFPSIFGCPGGFKKMRKLKGTNSSNFQQKCPPGLRAMTKKNKKVDKKSSDYQHVSVYVETKHFGP